jgi:two-component system chemotaxis response regulator CheB
MQAAMRRGGSNRPISAHDHILSSAGVPVWTGVFEIVVIGASFGGPPAVERLLGELPAGFPVPVIVCQHMTPGHTEQWAKLLDSRWKLSVHEAENNQRLQRGRVYIAPAGRHLRFLRTGEGSCGMRLDADFADSLHVPSIDFMFSSAAQVFGSRVLAVLLTGMGSDGATGMLSVRRAGGHTLVESQETAMSYSMPGAAVGLGAVVDMLPLDRLASRVAELGSRE